MNTRKYILVLTVFLAACAEEINTEVVVLQPEAAVAEAQSHFNEHGYRPITIASFGEQYHGNRNHPKEVIDCVVMGDLSLQLVRVESVKDKESIEYTNLYNDEMMRLQAVKSGCLNEKR